MTLVGSTIGSYQLKRRSGASRQRRRATGWVNATEQMHGPDGQTHGQARCQERMGDELVTGDPDEGGDQIATE